MSGRFRHGLTRPTSALRDSRRKLTGRWHLLVAIFAVLVLGAGGLLAVFIGLNWLITKDFPPKLIPPSVTGPQLLENLKVALTVIAGVGGFVALTVAYRRQVWLETDEAGKCAEQAALHERYGAAVAQLGHERQGCEGRRGCPG